MKVTVVGKSGFIARTLRDHPAGTSWAYLSHEEALRDTKWVAGSDVVINLAFSPRLRSEPYAESEDLDSRLARLIAPERAQYVMMSSRMVYGRPLTGLALAENQEPRPVNVYGRNKLTVERALAIILPEERLTILRASNVFGFEYGRKSFFGMAQTTLRDSKRIIYDMSPSVRRDFVAVWRLAPMLGQVAARPQGGIFNLGAGFGAEVGMIASWMIEGYGAGELVITKFSEDDQFFLDMNKSRQAFDFPIISSEDLHADCLLCGAALKAGKDAA